MNRTEFFPDQTHELYRITKIIERLKVMTATS